MSNTETQPTAEKTLLINGKLFAVYLPESNHLYLKVTGQLFQRLPEQGNEDGIIQIIETIENVKFKSTSYLHTQG